MHPNNVNFEIDYVRLRSDCSDGATLWIHLIGFRCNDIGVEASSSVASSVCRRVIATDCGTCSDT